MATGEDANFLENQLSRFNDIVANSIHLERGTRVIKAESSRFEKVLAKIPSKSPSGDRSIDDEFLIKKCVIKCAFMRALSFICLWRDIVDDFSVTSSHY